MSIPSFESQREAWSNPPVDDVGYISSESLMKLDDDELLEMIRTMETTRYSGWRNEGNMWREVLGLDSTHDKLVLDYGCGVGLEALQYAKAGNRVILADIAYSNLRLASRVLVLNGYQDIISGWIIGANLQPEYPKPQSIDIIHCAGVLHHIPDALSVVEKMAGWLVPGGELRLLLYSDVAWARATGSNPPKDIEVELHPEFDRFVRAMDSVGAYADWYDCLRMSERFSPWFSVKRCAYVGNQHFIGAVLRKR